MEHWLELPSRSSFAPRPYTGWALTLGCRLEASLPGGFLLSMFHMSVLKRQAIFSAMAGINWEAPEEAVARFRAVAPAECVPSLDPLAQIARALVTSRARQIVCAIYGEVPEGFLGALARVGDQPLPKGHYHLLHSLFSNPASRHKARALRHIGKIDIAALRVIQICDDPHLLSPAVIKLLAVRRHAEDFVATVRWLKGLDRVDGDALDGAIGRASCRRSLGRALQHCIERSETLPTQPVIDHPSYLVLSTVTLLREKGVEHRVCLTSGEVIREAVLGLVAFAERQSSSDEPTAIVELRPVMRGVSTEWLVASINLPENADVPPSLKEKVHDELGAGGFLLPIRPTGDDTAACVSRLMHRLTGIWLADLETE
jgi:hypothetical protein